MENDLPIFADQVGFNFAHFFGKYSCVGAHRGSAVVLKLYMKDILPE
jgi:hypothetical protein